MKSFSKIIFLNLLLLSSISAQDSFQVGTELSIDFDQMNIDLGKVNHGDTKTAAFRFVNTGKEAIEIEIVDGCVCTTLDWPRKPILPGEEGKIDVIFDSTEKEKSETIDIDVTLKNQDPQTGNPIFIFLTYKYELVF